MLGLNRFELCTEEFARHDRAESVGEMSRSGAAVHDQVDAIAEAASDPQAPDMLGIVEMKSHAEASGHTPRQARRHRSDSDEDARGAQYAL